MAKSNRPGNEPAFARPASEYTKQGTLADGNDAIPAETGLTKNEYARIAFAAALMSNDVTAMSDVIITAENIANQMFPTE